MPDLKYYFDKLLLYIVSQSTLPIPLPHLSNKLQIVFYNGKILHRKSNI